MLCLLAVALAACARPVPRTRASSVLNGVEVNDWAYQLQGRNGRALDLAGLAATEYDLVVVDYSADGGPGGEFSAEQIETLRQSPPGSPARIVLAYMSIGEAEDYRFYWRRSWRDRSGKLTDEAPDWLDRANPDWSDNYKVRYWDPAWQRILFGVREGRERSYLDRILDAGFDGVYLDIIDAYEYFRRRRGRRAAADMARLVQRLSAYARVERERSGFLVVPQNGSGILRELPPALRDAYLDAIDAIGAEDTFYYGRRQNDNPYRPQRDVLRLLARFQEEGKAVLAVDYVTKPAKVDRFYAEAAERGFIPFATVRALDFPTINPGHEPD